MRCLTTMVVLGALLTASSACGASASEIRWNELAPLIVGHEVTIPLMGGAVVGGDVLSVREDSLMLDIHKTSDATRYPRGQNSIARTKVPEIRLVERRGMGGRILGSIVGAIGGMVAGGEIAIHGTDSEAAAVSTFTATAVGCTVAGYYAGRSMDRRTRVLRIAEPLAAKQTGLPTGQ